MLAASLLPAAPAHATVTSTPSWCNGTATMKYSTWGIDKHVDSFSPNLNEEYRLAATAQYWYCPNGDQPSKIRVFSTTFCVTMLSETNWWEEENQVDGFKWNVWYGDDSSAPPVNPPQMELSWPNGQDQGDVKCQGQGIQYQDQRTMWMQYNPKWTLSGWVNINAHTDSEFTFKKYGVSYLYINGAGDPTV